MESSGFPLRLKGLDFVDQIEPMNAVLEVRGVEAPLLAWVLKGGEGLVDLGLVGLKLAGLVLVVGVSVMAAVPEVFAVLVAPVVTVVPVVPVILVVLVVLVVETLNAYVEKDRTDHSHSFSSPKGISRSSVLIGTRPGEQWKGRSWPCLSPRPQMNFSQRKNFATSTFSIESANTA